MPTRNVQMPPKEFRYRNRSVPASGPGGTDITTKTTYVTSIRVHNRTGTAATLTIRDKDTTPFEYYTTISIAPNSIENERINDGNKFVSGINLFAGTADALTIEIVGFQSP